MSPRSLLRLTLGAALPLLALIGCSGSSDRAARVSADRPSPLALTRPVPDEGAAAAPGQTAESGFYPLDLGDRWSYRTRFVTQIFPGGGPPLPPEELSWTTDYENVCIESGGEKSYVVRRFSSPQYPDPVVGWDRLRQDHSGLYLANLPPSIPPACDGGQPARRAATSERVRLENSWSEIASRVPADQGPAWRAAWERLEARRARVLGALSAGLREGAASDRGADPARSTLAPELLLLAYPLHKGAHWVSLDSPHVTYTVVGHENLDLPAGRMVGWHLHEDADFLGHRDRVDWWYSSAGFLRLELLLQGEATDEAGNPLGLLVTEQSTVLTDLSLVRGRTADRGAGSAANVP